MAAAFLVMLGFKNDAGCVRVSHSLQVLGSTTTNFHVTDLVAVVRGWQTPRDTI
jgi:hypothetical protein